MNLDPIRDMDKLGPVFRKKLEIFLKAMEKIDPMAPHETFRTDERQAMLFESGASKVKHSNHQDGQAADLHFTTGETFPKGGSARWIRAAEIARDFGIDNGGLLWGGFDWNHFQDSTLETKPLAELSPWQVEARHWAKLNHVSNGERPLDPITRVESMEMLRKFADRFKL